MDLLSLIQIVMLGSLMLGCYLFNCAISYVHFDDLAVPSASDALSYITFLSSGSILFLLGLGYLFHLAPSELDMRGFVLSAFMLLMMPIFEVLGLPLDFWVIIILIPTMLYCMHVLSKKIDRFMEEKIEGESVDEASIYETNRVEEEEKEQG